MRRFLRQTQGGREPLPLTMSGVRMGERVLQIGVNDPALAGAIAAKVGLSGHAALAVADRASADRATRGATESGSLIDIQVTPLDTLPFQERSFDVVVIHSMDGLLSRMEAGVRARALRECHRVLRNGGRVVAIEAGPREGLMARLLSFGPAPNPTYAAEGGSVGVLQVAGFKPVRLLAERDGYRFVEGLKTDAVT